MTYEKDWYFQFEIIDKRATIPTYSSKYSVGLDIKAIEDQDITTYYPRETFLIRTGLAVKFFVRKNMINSLSIYIR